MNIPEMISAGVATMAFALGGVSLYSSSVGKDRLTEASVATLLGSSKEVSEGLKELSTRVKTLEVKQAHTEEVQSQFLYSVRDLTNEVRKVNEHLLTLRAN